MSAVSQPHNTNFIMMAFQLIKCVSYQAFNGSLYSRCQMFFSTTGGNYYFYWSIWLKERSATKICCHRHTAWIIIPFKIHQYSSILRLKMSFIIPTGQIGQRSTSEVIAHVQMNNNNDTLCRNVQACLRRGPGPIVCSCASSVLRLCFWLYPNTG